MLPGNAIEVNNVCKTYGTHKSISLKDRVVYHAHKDTNKRREVLHDVSFDVKKGEALAIIGSSGSGKTTLLRCLNFLETPDKGQILVNGETLFDAADPAVESLDLRPDQCRILVANKIDRIDPAAAPVSLPDGALPLSAREGRGMEQLLERLRAAVDASALDDGRTIVSNSRHYEALHHARTALDAALGGLETLPSDLLGEEIRQAIFHLGTITGEITTDEVLDQIFSKFCIGK